MRKFVIILAAAMLVMAGCKKKQESESIIGRPSVTVQDGRFTPELMWKLGKMGEYALSPDGSKIAYTTTFYDMAQNKGNAEIYLIPTDGKSEAMRLTNTSQSEFNPVWLNASTLLFARGNDICSIDIDSKAEKVLGTIESGLEGFKVSPDGTQILYISDLPVRRPDDINKLYTGLDQTTGRINEDLMYRHWDNWVDEYPPHLPCLAPEW